MPGVTDFASRLVPARRDVAARHLEGQVAAERFVDGETRRVVLPLLDLTASPDPEGERATQLLLGERFTVYDERNGIAWGQAEADGYVGYVLSGGLAIVPAREAEGEGRRVSALRSHVYPSPSVRARPLGPLPFLGRVAVSQEEDGWAHLDGGGYVPAPHLAPIGGDFVAQAARFLGVPYLWGGRSAEGLDCSALVQLALAAAGVRAPRDSDMQEALVGEAIPDGAPGEAGDLVFWRGHVGIMVDAETLLHANGHAMAVTAEPLAVVAARVAAAGGGPVTARRRGAADRGDWLTPA